MSDRPAAIVLAGGGSRRMGQDKASLALDGQPLLAHVLELLAGCCAPIVIAARPGQDLPGLDLPGVEVLRVDDPVADAGPLVGLGQALAVLEQRGIAEAYLSSCDAAGLSAAHLRWMLDRLAQSRGAIAVVPVDEDGRRHPLASAIVVTPMRARVEAALAAGIGRLQAPFDPDAGILAVPIAELPDPTALDPCNTPEQWAAWLSRRSRSARRP